MAKYEYKTLEVKDQKGLVQELDALGEAGWELIDRQEAYGWQICLFKRSLGDDTVSGLETLSQLTNLLSDPSKTQKLISDLKTAYDTHVKSLDQLRATQDTISKAQADLGVKNKDLESKITVITARDQELNQKSTELAKKAADLDRIKAEHQKTVSEYEKKIESDRTALQNSFLTSQTGLNARDNLLTSKEASLTAREKDLDAREASLNTKVAEHAKLSEQAESFLAVMRRR